MTYLFNIGICSLAALLLSAQVASAQNGTNKKKQNTQYASLTNFGKLDAQKVVRKKMRPQFSVRPFSIGEVKNKQWVKATSLENLSADFPSSWIDNYKTVTLRSEETEQFVIGLNNELNQGQRAFLDAVPVGGRFQLRVDYERRSEGGRMEKKVFEHIYTRAPDTDAAFGDSPFALAQYLETHFDWDLLDGWKKEKAPGVEVKFVINSHGELEDLRVVDSNVPCTVHNSIFEVLKGMPRWTPARLESGETVRQEFRLVLGENGC